MNLKNKILTAYSGVTAITTFGVNAITKIIADGYKAKDMIRETGNAIQVGEGFMGIGIGFAGAGLGYLLAEKILPDSNNPKLKTIKNCAKEGIKLAGAMTPLLYSNAMSGFTSPDALAVGGMFGYMMPKLVNVAYKLKKN